MDKTFTRCFPVIVLLLFKLTKGQSQCPPGLLASPQCSSNPNNYWASCLSAVEIATSNVTLSWTSHRNSRESYQLYWRELRAGSPPAAWSGSSALNGTFTDAYLPNNLSYQFDGLLSGTDYEIRVCLYPTSQSMLTSQASRRCGLCRLTFTTHSPVVLLAATVEELADNRKQYICVANGVPQPTLSWSVHQLSQDRRAPLPAQGEYELVTNSTVDGVTSVLTYEPDEVPFDSPWCLLENAVSSLRVDTELFEDITVAELTVTVPLYVILLSAVIPTVTTIIVIGILIAILCVFKRRKQNRKLSVFAKEANHYSNTVPLNPVASCDADTSALYGLLQTSLPKNMIVPSSSIKVSTVIGQGEFGVVYKGTLTKSQVQEVVAVKTLKGIFATASEVQSFTEEILLLNQFHHPNVMSLIGVCVGDSKATNPSIILPFMAKGSLLDFVRKETHRLKPAEDSDITQIGAVEKNLVQICLQIAKGMEYLAGQRFVHRDLAARNCMIDQNDQIRVGDFGLSEDIYARNYFKQSASDGVKLPVKWMAPESLKLGIFNEKTDVWSYGVTSWEVFSCGEIPYPGVHPQEVLPLLEEGQRLRKPNNPACSDQMYSVMLACWNSDSDKRYQFTELHSVLESQLQAMSDYLDLNVISSTTFNQPEENDYYRASDGDSPGESPSYKSSSNGRESTDLLVTKNYV